MQTLRFPCGFGALALAILLAGCAAPAPPPRTQRIDFRSRSVFGLFDWCKNRAHMVELTARFEQQGRP